MLRISYRVSGFVHMYNNEAFSKRRNIRFTGKQTLESLGNLAMVAC